MRESDLVNLQNVRWSVLNDAALQVKYGWDPNACKLVIASIANFKSKRDAYQDVNSTKNRQEKDAAKEASITEMRDFAAMYIRNNPAMSKAEKEELGVKVRDKILTRAVVPATFPVSDFDLSIPGRIIITSADSNTGRKARPEGVRWVEHRWQYYAERPASAPNVADLGQSNAWTRPSQPFFIDFDTEKRQGCIAHSSCWVNTRGEQGPFEPVKLVSIPWGA
jgi:hypothetical protein